MTRFWERAAVTRRRDVARAAELLAAAAVLAVAGCSGTPGEPVPPSSTAATPTEPPPEAPDGEATEPSLSQSEQVAALWEDYHAAYLEQLGAEQIDPAAFDGLAVDPEAVAAQLTTERDALGNRLVSVEVEHWPEVRVVSDGREAEVTDCVIASQYPATRGEEATATASSLWQVSVINAEDGWRVQSATAHGHLCIAAELNTELLSAYERWTEARKDWFDPPDPDHPLLDEVMTEPGLADMRANLEQLREEGIAVEDPRSDLSHAVVSDLGIGTARVTDCYPASLGAISAVDSETRRPIDEANPDLEPDANNRMIVDFERQADGGWLAVGYRAGANADCEPGQSAYAPA